MLKNVGRRSDVTVRVCVVPVVFYRRLHGDVRVQCEAEGDRRIDPTQRTYPAISSLSLADRANFVSTRRQRRSSKRQDSEQRVHL